ncbi:MAG: hypothetical protein HQK60_18970 [Deltaproteobacteria bacterium]|nr:hypothetical protein [Deltaproteobacteria bacterium]
MALSVSIATNFGIPATYWNIGRVEDNFREKSNNITLFGYVNQAARESNSQPLAGTTTVISGDDYTPELARAQIYTIIKTKPEWATAEDC